MKAGLENLLDAVEGKNMVGQVCFQDFVRDVAFVEENYNTEGGEDEPNHVEDGRSTASTAVTKPRYCMVHFRAARPGQ